jgi:hypothetical protein
MFGCAPRSDPLDLLGLSIAKRYCVSFENGDTVVQRPLSVHLPFRPAAWLHTPDSGEESAPNNSESDSNLGRLGALFLPLIKEVMTDKRQNRWIYTTFKTLVLSFGAGSSRSDSLTPVGDPPSQREFDAGKGEGPCGTKAQADR